MEDISFKMAFKTLSARRKERVENMLADDVMHNGWMALSMKESRSVKSDDL